MAAGETGRSHINLQVFDIGLAPLRERRTDIVLVSDAFHALGIHPPILLGFPDAQLGSYMEDPMRLFQLTARMQEELQRLHPDAVITWGPDGATGHPDHRIVSSVVTQLVGPAHPARPSVCSTSRFPSRDFAR